MANNKMFMGFYPCKQCNYTAPPELRKSERKHFDSHAYECTRCLWRPEAMPTPEQAITAWNTRADQSPPVAEPVEALDAYDAGLLSDFGGGNVEWWQDYIRSELERAHEFYQSQMPT